MKDVPKDRMKDVTYGQFVCMVRPEKAEQNWTRFIVGGDKINCPGEVATSTAEMLVAKLLFNSDIQMIRETIMTMDISTFYWMTPLKCPEFIRISIWDIPDEIIKEYNFKEKMTPNGSISIRANHGMYGIPSKQASGEWASWKTIE